MTEETEKKQENIEEIPEEYIWDMFRFARELQNGLYPGILTPDLINARMRDISYNPVAATEATLNTALTDPKSNETQLRQFGQSFELTSQSYKRLISYLGNLLAFDYTYTSNAQSEDYNTPAYKKDIVRVWEFFDKFNVKQEFSIAVKQMLRNEAFFFTFREDGDKYVLQELDANYCKITARFDYGLLFSFNMYYFMMPGVDINLFPSFFKEKFTELFKGKHEYIPSLPVDMRGQSSWVYWQDIPPEVGFCFKLSPELAVRIPYFTALFPDLILQPLMRLLQKNKSIAAASKIIFGEVPLLNKDQKTVLKDAIAISPDILAKFLTLLKSGVGDAVKVASAPLSNVKGISFPPEDDVYHQFLTTSVASSGVNSNLIFTSGTRPNVIETQLSLNTDEQLMEAIYPQLNSFLNFQLNKITKKFKFKVVLEGTNFFTNRQQRLEPLQILMNSGIVLPQKIAAALGIEPHVFEQQLAEAVASGFVNKLTPIVPATNLSSGAQNAGRPQKSDSEISDEGAQTRQDGGNIGKGGKI